MKQFLENMNVSSCFSHSHELFAVARPSVVCHL